MLTILTTQYSLSWMSGPIVYRPCTGGPQCLNFVFSFFAVLEFELRTYTLTHSTSPFLCVCDGFFEIGSCKLFAQAGFKPRAS
jgi:hypothetical protein